MPLCAHTAADQHDSVVGVSALGGNEGLDAVRHTRNEVVNGLTGKLPHLIRDNPFQLPLILRVLFLHLVTDDGPKILDRIEIGRVRWPIRRKIPMAFTKKIRRNFGAMTWSVILLEDPLLRMVFWENTGEELPIGGTIHIVWHFRNREFVYRMDGSPNVIVPCPFILWHLGSLPEPISHVNWVSPCTKDLLVREDPLVPVFVAMTVRPFQSEFLPPLCEGGCLLRLPPFEAEVLRITANRPVRRLHSDLRFHLRDQLTRSQTWVPL
jgi:hypothetical protein